MAPSSSRDAAASAVASSSSKPDEGRISCAECRRRKLKCDRAIPCNQCTKRGCSPICPDGTLAPKNARASDFGKEFNSLKARLERAEKLLKEHGIAFDGDEEASGGAQSSGGSKIALSKGKEREGTGGQAAEQGNRSSRGAGDDGDEPASRVKVEECVEDWQHSFGTLVLGEEGSARYVGASAGSEWLSSESMCAPPTSSASPATSDVLSPTPTGFDLPMTSIFLAASHSTPPLSYQGLRESLPPLEYTLKLVSLYYTHFSWNYNVVLESTLMTHISAFYSASSHHSNSGNAFSSTWTTSVHPHRLALIFMVLSTGSLYDLETDPNDFSVAERYYKLATASLSIANFLDASTIPALQCLHIMANYHLYVDRIKGGDYCWPLWGLIMRLIQAMGIHRDGACWNLPRDAREERRRLFWETYSEDIFQANCFGRPGGMSTRHFDVKFPEEERPANLPADFETPASFGTYKFMLSKISSEVLDQVMNVQAPSYTAVRVLWHKLVAFERTIPFHLRCRAAAFAMPSAYPLPADAIRDSPEVDPSNVKLTFQRHLLALNVCEAVFFLQRPFFARALKENPSDPSRGSKGEPFLTVVERCGIIIALVTSLQAIYPSLAPRQWFFWYHGSSAAVCMSALVISAPRSPLAMFGWSTLTSFTNLLASLPNPSKSNKTSLALLLRLSTKAWEALVGSTQIPTAPASASPGFASSRPNDNSSDENDESNHLLGLHTRLIARFNGQDGRDSVVRGSRSSTSQAALDRSGSWTGMSSRSSRPLARMSSQSSPSGGMNQTSSFSFEPSGYTPLGSSTPSSSFPDFSYTSNNVAPLFPQNPFSIPSSLPPPSLPQHGLQQPSLRQNMDVDLNELSDAGFVAALWADPAQELSYSNFTNNQSINWEEFASQLGINVRTAPSGVPNSFP